jgi:IrrE N-terminal-like domain
MSDFRIRFEWEESPRVRAPELHATWARLEIHVGAQTITHVAQRSSSVRFGIYVPLFPHLRADKRRFVIARAIGDFLSFGHSSLVTRGQTEHQQRNRAFAAEFLAPAHSIRERLPNATVDEEDVEELAAEFQVSPIVIRHQIQNHRLAEFSG